MTIKDLISQITQGGYVGQNLYLRLTGKSSEGNLILMKGEKENGKFKFSATNFSSKKLALDEIKRLIKIYYVTDKPGLHSRTQAKCYGYKSQIING